MCFTASDNLWVPIYYRQRGYLRQVWQPQLCLWWWSWHILPTLSPGESIIRKQLFDMIGGGGGADKYPKKLYLLHSGGANFFFKSNQVMHHFYTSLVTLFFFKMLEQTVFHNFPLPPPHIEWWPPKQSIHVSSCESLNNSIVNLNFSCYWWFAYCKGI